MRVFITTVAGTATRFNRDIEKPTAKCIYYQKHPKDTILYHLLVKAKHFDRIIVVGGYLYQSIIEYANTYLLEFSDKIDFIFNPKYDSYGSGYSLVLGLEASEKYSPKEIVFAEGDLFFDSSDFEALVNATQNAIAVNIAPIESNKSVVVYVNEDGRLKYLYDALHKSLFIEEPFLAVYNSGQIWKFNNVFDLYNIAHNLSQKQIEGTNLEIIGTYFFKVDVSQVAIISFKNWINCNTIEDYKLISRQREGHPAYERY